MESVLYELKIHLLLYLLDSTRTAVYAFPFFRSFDFVRVSLCNHSLSIVVIIIVIVIYWMFPECSFKERDNVAYVPVHAYIKFYLIMGNRF